MQRIKHKEKNTHPDRTAQIIGAKEGGTATNDNQEMTRIGGIHVLRHTGAPYNLNRALSNESNARDFLRDAPALPYLILSSKASFFCQRSTITSNILPVEANGEKNFRRVQPHPESPAPRCHHHHQHRPWSRQPLLALSVDDWFPP